MQTLNLIGRGSATDFVGFVRSGFVITHDAVLGDSILLLLPITSSSPAVRALQRTADLRVLSGVVVMLHLVAASMRGRAMS